MPRESPVRVISRLSAEQLGIFRGRAATNLGVTRKQLTRLLAAGVIERVLPDTYRLTAVAPTREQKLRAALAWGGSESVAAGRSAAERYGLEGVRAISTEIVVPRSVRRRSREVTVRQYDDRRALMVRLVQGLPTTGIECTLLHLAATLSEEAFEVACEVACEDARRRRLTSVPALRAYLGRHGRQGRAGVAAVRRLLDELDPVHASRSTLEVKTRRLLVANGFSTFTREFPLQWNGVTYRFDFAFTGQHTILETNGRRWHDDPNDYERDNEKWSVPGRHGFRLVLATWAKVTRRPDDLLYELATTLAA